VSNPTKRLPYLDWMRGLAAVIMLQGHVFDGWVRAQDRSSEWFWFSQYLGGLPAPIFLFLVGVSLALVLDKMRSKGAPAQQLVLKVARRGGWILFLAYAFRIEQYLMWYPASDIRDVFRVDTLNCIALCTLAIGLFSIMFKTRRANIIAMSVTTATVVFATPIMYPLRLPLPSFMLSYFNGNGHPSYFSLIPWVAFALAGMTFGYLLLAGKEAGEPQFFRWVAIAGICAYAAGTAMNWFPVFRYGFFDYSLTSPHFFLIRLGLLLLILYGAYKWSTRVRSNRWSPIIVFGQASLPVYWIHIEIVYGRPFHNFAQGLDLSLAARQLLWVIPCMLAIAAARQIGFSRGFRELRSLRLSSE
jgi:uncharacterized membrane protein